ncbi:MAG: hypothetical protein EOO63_17305, partial [Hymenobacter sp.]
MAASSFAVTPVSSSTRQAWRFGLLCGTFILLWFIGSAYGLGIDSALDDVLCHQLAAASAWGLRAAGWAATTDVAKPTLLLLNRYPSVFVGAKCDGLVLYALLAGFVLAYPGPAQRRLWFIPLGIVALWLLNIARIIALALNYKYSPETFEFDHHYAFNAVAYAALGGLWLLWTRQAGLATAEASITPAVALPVAPRQRWLTTQTFFGLALLLVLIAISIFRNEMLGALNHSWDTLLATGPTWIHRLPGATAGAIPEGVSHLALPVGAAYTAFFLVASLATMRLLLPRRSWRLVWRCYAGLVLTYLLLL